MRTEVVRRGVNVAVLAAVEAEALGGLVVLLGAAGLDVGAAREGPQVRVRFDENWGNQGGQAQEAGAGRR